MGLCSYCSFALHLEVSSQFSTQPNSDLNSVKQSNSHYFPKGLKIKINLGSKVIDPNNAAIMAKPVSSPK